jgi:hypothetical protein
MATSSPDRPADERSIGQQAHSRQPLVGCQLAGVCLLQRAGDSAAFVYPLLDLLLLVNSLWQDQRQCIVVLCMCVLVPQGIADLRSARLLRATNGMEKPAHLSRMTLAGHV